MSRIEDILVRNDPMLTGTLSKILMTKYGQTSTASRQEISRVKPPVRKLKYITFDNNQRFIHLEEQFNSDEYFKELLKNVNDYSRAYSYFFKALEFHNGFLSIKQIPAYSASPIEPLKGHRIALKIIEDLKQSRIIDDYSDEILYINPQIHDRFDFIKYKTLELIKKIIMKDFIDWATKINLVSFNTPKSLDEVPEFFKLQWSFSSPSYIEGLTKRGKSIRPGFVVGDILIGKKVSGVYVEYFLKKIDILKSNNQVSAFIPFLIIDNIASDTFTTLKNKGILLLFVERLFGSDYVETLRSLAYVIENASAIVTKDPNKYFELMNSLTKIEGRSFHLKGDLFELAVGYYYSLIKSRFIEINKEVLEYSSGKRKEIDVFVRFTDFEIRVIECKGYNYPLDESYIKKWLTENIPTIRKWLLHQDEYKDLEFCFELWSTGGFDAEGEKLLKEFSATVNANKYSIKYFGKEEIRKRFLETKEKNLERIIKEYYNL